MNDFDTRPPAAVAEADAEPAESDIAALADRVLETVPRIMRRIRGRMRSHGRDGITVPQLRVLLYVRRHPGTALSPVADHVGVTKAAASTLVDRLVRAGYLDRTDDPAERRRIQLRLTAAGAERVGLAHLDVRSWLASELAALPPRQRAHLGPALDALVRLDARADAVPAHAAAGTHADRGTAS
ncbi:MAG TPA: MarR family transcriptional regulator [Candidatus Limnocylindrales bacterium]|nr:MarR family transcriptional regulator [Candidatus Limnocylindrales bacterium]